MEAGFVALLILGIIGGIIVGVFLGYMMAHRRYMLDTKHTQGTLNIDCSDPEFEPELFLALGVPVKDITARKYIVLDVNVMRQNSQK